MENEKYFKYSDIEYLLDNVPYDSNQDNDNEIQSFIEKSFDDYNFNEYGKNALTYDLDYLSNNLNSQPILQYLYGCVDFCTTAFYYFCEKKSNKIENDYVSITIRKIGENLIQKVNAFCYLFIKDDYSDAISISRSIYELVLSAHLIYEYPQLAEPYRDKEAFLTYKFYKESKVFFPDYSIKKEFYSLLDKYGDTLNENFGWTAKVFPEKEKRLHKNLAKKLELHDLVDSCYQKACAYVHAAPYSLVHQEIQECLPFSGWVIELLYKYCNDFFSLSFMNKKERKVMNNLSIHIVIFYIREMTKFYTEKEKEINT